MVKYSGVVTLIMAAIFVFAGLVRVFHTPESALQMSIVFSEF
jgi:hypothetical protein